MKNEQKKKAVANCDSCEFFDYNEDTDSYECSVNLDEDDYYRFACGQTRECPYYRYYDEYKSVQKQN